MSIVVILYYLGSNDKEKNPHIRTYSVQLLKKNPRLVKLADVMGHTGTAVDRMQGAEDKDRKCCRPHPRATDCSLIGR